MGLVNWFISKGIKLMGMALIAILKLVIQSGNSKLVIDYFGNSKFVSENW